MTVLSPESAQELAVVPSGVNLATHPYACASTRGDADGFDVTFYPTEDDMRWQLNAYGTRIHVAADRTTEVL